MRFLFWKNLNKWGENEMVKDVILNNPILKVVILVVSGILAIGFVYGFYQIFIVFEGEAPTLNKMLTFLYLAGSLSLFELYKISK